jgi:pyrroloquinoline quinone biosynthesis protein B
MMRIRILGAAAGGGFPQWNSNAPACRRARSGDQLARPRTQASVAVSADGHYWFLLNASPDLRQQIEASSVLHPHAAPRSSPISGVVLTGGDIDAIAGLLCLREHQPFSIYATPTVMDVLAANPIFRVLDEEVVRRQAVPLGHEQPLLTASGLNSGLTLELFAVPGKVPLYLEPASGAPTIKSGENTVGACISDGLSQLHFIPGCAAMPPQLAHRLRGAELVLFDGTLWRDDEMIRAGLGTKTGRRMGHMSLSGPDGTIAAFTDLEVRRKVLLHINNSNPVLLEDSAERAQVEAAGWEVAWDGMELAL